MHHQKPGAVFPASQRCSEGGQSCCRVRGSALIMAAAYPAPALTALRAMLGRWGDCSGLPMVHDERDRAVPPLNSTVILDPLQRLDLPGARLSHRARKKEGLKFPTKSQWKSFGKVLIIFCGLQMILQLAESISAVTQILPLAEKRQKKESRCYGPG